jgi:hypothetical protein
LPLITELYAYVIADTGPDDEGVPAFADPATGLWMPMMGADYERAASLRDQAIGFANSTGKPIKLIRSLALETVEVIHPQQGTR